MKIIGDEMVFDGRFISVLRRRFMNRIGNEQVWEMLKRKSFGRIVMIAALTPERELILERVFRVPFGAYVIELPAGVMDKAGESEEDAARRELLEETGYAAERMILMTAGPYDQGLTTDEIAVYAAFDARLVGPPHLDDAEDIEVIKVPLAKLLDFMAERRDEKIDIKIAAVLPFLERELRHASV